MLDGKRLANRLVLAERAKVATEELRLLNGGRPRLAISFSGGRSSAVMLKLCLSEYSATHDIQIVFANTGDEHEETLRFVDAVDRNFAAGQVVWIEAEINGQGVGPTAKVVTYETASRNQEPFEAAIEKHGVFCMTHPQCTSRLKEEPMISYRRSQGWEAGSYDTAIGIRADEIDRCSSKAAEKRFIYPLVDAGFLKRDVNRFMARFDWDLDLTDDADGNCKGCWKKSQRKLMTIAQRTPDVFDFYGRMERTHGMKSNGEPQKAPRVFFRGNRSAQDILKAAFTTKFKPYRDDVFDQPGLFDNELDLGGGCGESCEIGADE